MTHNINSDIGFMFVHTCLYLMYMAIKHRYIYEYIKYLLCIKVILPVSVLMRIP